MKMKVTNGDVLDMFHSGNKDMEKAILASGISRASMKKAQAWSPPSKMPKDYVAIGEILQTFTTE